MSNRIALWKFIVMKLYVGSPFFILQIATTTICSMLSRYENPLEKQSEVRRQLERLAKIV